MPVASVFQWEGDGVQVNRRKNNELYYKSFKHDELRVSVGDYVLVRNDDSLDPEDHLNCFIAEVKDLFDAGEGDEPYKARVQWYSRVMELPPKYSKLLKDTDSRWEVVEEQRKQWEDVIDAESIFKKCVIIFLPKDSRPGSETPHTGKNCPVFYCRFQFTGLRFVPILLESKRIDGSKQNKNSLYATPGNRKSLRKNIQSKAEVELPEEQKTLPEKNGFDKDFSKEISNSHSKPLKINGIKLKTLSVTLPKLKDEVLEKFGMKSDFNVLSNGSLKLETSQSRLSLSLKKNRQTTDEKTSISSPVSGISRLSLKTPEKNSEDDDKDGGTPSKRAKFGPADRRCKTEPRSEKDGSKSPVSKRLSSRRSLKFDGEPNSVNESNGTTVTRYGRKVKPVCAILDSDMEALLATPKKTKPVSRATAAPQPKAKFYVSDTSDSEESVYKPSEDSESGEENFSENEVVTPRSKTRAITPKHKTRNATPKSKQKYTPVGKGSRTPCYKKRITSVATPTIPERERPVKTPQSLLEESRQRLHVSAVPYSLPCRDEEYADIYAFVESNLIDNTGGCMYISGVPGTGKTATVHEVMRNLEKERDKGTLPPFKFIEVNGMKMTDPYQCYVQIFKKLTGERIAPQQAGQLLEKRFTRPGPKKEAVVLLVDELDKLWTRKQTVMYNIFDWPTKPSSKLIVVAIANTLDLPERLMMSRISSRLGLTRRTFQPYSFRELQQIVMSRIQELEVFDSDAVQLVARKVAAVSGDARRALEICKRAAEVAEEGTVKASPSKKKKVLVGMAHVDAALQQMLSSPEVTAVRGCSQLQKMFFHALLAEFQRTGCEEATMFRVYRQLVGLCRFEGVRPPTSSEVSALCCHLASSFLILIDSVQNDLFMKIRLNISIDDVNYALSKSLN